VQSEIAETIAQQLHAHISPQTRAAIEAKPTSDLVAYDLYLQAAQLWHNIGTSKDWEGDTRKGIDFLGRAVERDPQFGIAYGLLTELNLNLYSWVDHSMAREQRAKAALEQAMRAAPEAGETYIARAAFYNVVDHNPDAVLEMLQHAVQLMPGDSNLLVRLANNQARHGLWDEAVRTLEKGRELDPRGPNIPNNLKTFYEAMRQYAKCDKLCDEAIAAFPDGPGYFLAEKVETARHRGDTKLARARLAAIPKEWDPSGYRSFLAILIAIDDRNYDEAAQLFASLNRENVRGFLTTDLAILEAFVARKRGEEERARSIIERAREAKSKEVAEHPNENTPLSELAELDACLGRKEDAVREAERAVELRPISRDAVAGPEFVYSLAKVCATTGDHDRAIQLLGEVASIPAGPSYGQLLMPTWDELRGDPRFEKIVASLKPKEK
jgi:tetratricopeptide (TPR) repeat protein